MSLVVNTGRPVAGRYNRIWSREPCLSNPDQYFCQCSPAGKQNNRTTSGKARTSYLVMLATRPLKGCEEVMCQVGRARMRETEGRCRRRKVEHERGFVIGAFRSDLSTRSQWVTRCWLRHLWKANKSSNGKSPPMPKRYGQRVYDALDFENTCCALCALRSRFFSKLALNLPEPFP